MELTPGQRYIIARSRQVADDPDSVIPDDYPADDYNGRNAFLVGYLTAQLKALADVAGDIAGPEHGLTLDGTDCGCGLGAARCRELEDGA